MSLKLVPPFLIDKFLPNEVNMSSCKFIHKMFKCVKRIVTHAGTVFVSFFIVLSDNICVVPVNPGTITMMVLISFRLSVFNGNFALLYEITIFLRCWLYQLLFCVVLCIEYIRNRLVCCCLLFLPLNKLWLLLSFCLILRCLYRVHVSINQKFRHFDSFFYKMIALHSSI